MDRMRYVLITPARNEEANIERAIHSVISQTVVPLKWVIVNDRSTDMTEEIVRKYQKDHRFIELTRIDGDEERNFGSLVRALRRGYEIIKDVDYDFLGKLDADISFEADPDYMEYLLLKFAEDPQLGVAGTPFVEGTFRYDYKYTNIAHVHGGCYIFRRQCHEEAGAFIAVKGGGYDWIAVTTARMKGWKTQTFEDKVCIHHRRMSSAVSGVFTAQFRHGMKDYYLGGHPVWELFRCLYQMREKPYFLGGGCLGAGYAWAGLRRMERPVSDELMRFHRKEQMARLGRIARRFLP